MKSFLLSFALTATLLINPLPTFAQEATKTITLMDGTKVKGKIVSFANGVYTVNTSNLGNLTIKDSDVVNISAAGAPEAAATNSTANSTSSIQGQVNQMQNSLMSDPQMMEDVKNLLDNPEIMNMLSDKQFISDVMSYDPARIESNQKTKQLIENPEVQQLMEKIGQKYGTQAEGQPEK